MKKFTFVLITKPCLPLRFFSRFHPAAPQGVLSAFAMMGVVVLFASGAAQAAIVPVAVLGNAAPDGNGRLNNFGRPGINNAGQVGFTSENFDTAGSGDELAMNLRSVTGGPILQIARANQTVPGGNGKFSSFSFASEFNAPPALNDSGAFAFHTLLTQTTNGPLDDRAIYFGSGGPLSLVVRGGQPLPEGNGNFYRFDSFTMNSVGQIAFSATVEPITGGTAADTGLYIGSASSAPQKIAREGDLAPDGNGTYSLFSAGALNASGKVAFYSELIGATGGAANDQVLILGSGTAPSVLLVREGQNVPDGNGKFMAFAPPAINSLGDVVFVADLNFSASVNVDSGIYRVPGTGGGPQLVIRENEPAPDGNGVFRSFMWSCLNNSGRVAMHAVISGSAGGVNDGGGIFLVSGGLPRRQVVRRNFSAPGGGTFASLDDQALALNNGGQVAFAGNFTAGGSGLFIGNGVELVQIVRVGQTLAGGNVTAATLLANIPVSDDHRSAINDFGQVAFFATMSGGAQQGVFVFTPVLNFQSSGSNNFEFAGNWTLGIPPALVHDVVFNPTNNVTLLGPTNNQAVKSLQVGGGAGTATLQLQQGVTLSVTSNLTIAATGVLAGNGTVAGRVLNGGLISAGSSAGKIVVSNLTQLPAGRMLFEIGGATVGSFDQLDVAQTLSLTGTLDVVLMNGFTPQGGQTFDLMNWGAINGTFATVNLPALPGGLSWDATNLYASGTLRVIGGAPTALQAWRQQYFGTTENMGTAADTEDPDHDGTVNFLEFAILTDPTVANKRPVGLAIAGANLEFTYQRNKAALSQATYAVQWSETLLTNSWSATGVSEVMLSDDGTVQQFKATLPAGGPYRFVRLSITNTAP